MFRRRNLRWLRLPWLIPLLALSALLLALLPVGRSSAQGATFTVNSANDVNDGVCNATHCSLREAIAAANATPGLDTIAFNIPGAGPHTIQPASALPAITDPVVIDGYTQPGASPNTNGPGLGLNTVLKIELDGTNTAPPLSAPINGLVVTAGNSTVRGLVINRFGLATSGVSDGNGIYLSTNGSNVIEGNFIGTDVTGSVDLGNDLDGVGIGVASPNNIIGGTAAGARNVISGNDANGVDIFGFLATGNLVQGNLIGTDVTGTIALGNLRGVWVSTALNTIGGSSIAERNVISGNGLSGNPFSGGVRINGTEATSNKVQGNFIGTDVTGTLNKGNTGHGVFINDAPGNTVGGAVSGARNVISGNGLDGLRITGTGAIGNQVQGNFIGVAVTGAAALGNSFEGVLINAPGNIIGGTTPERRNIISGNVRGIVIAESFATSNLIQGNFIGTDVSGTAALGNSIGIAIGGPAPGAPGNTIGGTIAGARNVISGNGTGILLLSSATTGNLVQGNFIGTDVTGAAALGNSTDGVRIFDGASNNTMGGAGSGAGNTMAFNGGHGVSVGSGTANAILGNAMFSNAGLGIELGASGVTANDPGDADTGANNLQNFPVLPSSQTATNQTKGTLNSTPNTSFRLEFFSNSACDPSGHGEGQTFLGFTNVTTDPSGNAAFNPSFSTSVSVGHFITATATDTANNTSEFSQCAIVIQAPPVATVTVPGLMNVTVGTSGAAAVNVLNVPGGNLGAYQFQVSYNSAVVQATAVQGGAAPFDAVTAVRITNAVSGAGVWNHFQGGQVTVPVSGVTVANLLFQAVGMAGACSPLSITVVDLVNNQGGFIPNTKQDGQVCLVGISALAQTDLRAAKDPPDLTATEAGGATGVKATIDQITSSVTGASVAGVLLHSYEANISFPPALAQATDCRLKPPINLAPSDCTINPTLGQVHLKATTGVTGSGTATMPLDPLAFVALRLLGSNNPATGNTTVNLNFVEIRDSLGSLIPQATPPDTRTFLRGDALADGSISIGDALYIGQHLVNSTTRPAGEGPGKVNAVNAGSVNHDTPVDVISLADAVLIAQFLVGNVNEFYLPPPP